MITDFLHLICTDAIDVGDTINNASQSTVDLSGAIDQYGFLVVGAAVLFVILFICVGFVFVTNMRILGSISKQTENSHNADENLISNIVERLLQERNVESISPDDLDKLKADLNGSLSKYVADLEADIKKINTKKSSTDFLSSYMGLSSIFKDASRKAFCDVTELASMYSITAISLLMVCRSIRCLAFTSGM